MLFAIVRRQARFKTETEVKTEMEEAGKGSALHSGSRQNEGEKRMEWQEWLLPRNLRRISKRKRPQHQMRFKLRERSHRHRFGKEGTQNAMMVDGVGRGNRGHARTPHLHNAPDEVEEQTNVESKVDHAVMSNPVITPDPLRSRGLRLRQ
jgi:hypothetical protein